MFEWYQRGLKSAGDPVWSPKPFTDLNTGHGTLGWTMACGSAQVIADLIAGRTPEIDLEGLGLDRFS